MSEPVPDSANYESVTNKVVEVQTPTSQTRFHAPNDKVEFDREKYEYQKQQTQERTVQSLHAVMRNSRGQR